MYGSSLKNFISAIELFLDLRKSKVLKMSKISRRKYIAATGAVVAAAAVGGAAWWYYSQPKGPKEVRVLNYSFGGAHETILANKDDFKSKTGYDLVVESNPWTGYADKATMSLKLKEGTYDVLNVNCDWHFPSWAPAGYLENLNPYIEKDKYDLSDFIPAGINHMALWPSKPGQPGTPARAKPSDYPLGDIMYGIPYLNDAAIMVYRKDLFEDAGFPPPPDNGYEWNEFTDYAKALTKGDVFGTLFPGKTPHGVFDHWQCTYFGQGGRDMKVLDATFHAAFDNAVGRWALQEIYDMYWKHKICPNPIATDYTDCPTIFKAGKAASYRGWGCGEAQMVLEEYNPYWNVTGFMVPPHGESGLPSSYFAGWTWAIAANSTNKDGAWEFMKWVNSKEMQKKLAPAVPPGRMSVYTDPEVLARCPHYKAMLGVVQSGLVNPQLPEMWELNEAIGKEFQPFINGERTLDAAIRAAVDAANLVMQTAGYF
jgi:multiple sugar transport system substrate-binding protein